MYRIDFNKELSKNEESIRINKELRELYEKWISSTFSKGILEFSDKWTFPTLLKCTDEYLEKRIMLFGRESNERGDRESLVDILEKYDDDYFFYKYMCEIVGVSNKKCQNTPFLKIRKKLSCIEEDFENLNYEEKVINLKTLSGVLVNNVNKTSLDGKKTCFEIVEQLYKKFEFNGKVKSIFQHEIDILQPKMIIFACGVECVKIMKTLINPEAKTWCIDNQPKLIGGDMVIDITKCFNKSNKYKCKKVIWAIHPSAHFKNDTEYCFENYQEAIGAHINS
jgi:hypothetical protein